MECDRAAIKRGLCNTHYQAHYRAGDLWQFPDLRIFDDEKAIEGAIECMYQFYYDKLIVGFDEYIEGSWIIEDDGRGLSVTKTGNAGYDASGTCNECGDTDKLIGRGLCTVCYHNVKYEGFLDLYPTKDFVKNPEGYIFWVLNNHLDKVIDIGVEYGLTVSRFP